MPSARMKVAPPAEPAGRSVRAIPTVWLIFLAVLIVAPWLAAGSYFWWPRGATRSPTPADGLSTTASGPWGTLILSPIVISPPLELLPDNWARDSDAGKQWFFPAIRPDEMAALLSWIGFGSEDVAALMRTARVESRMNAVVITPDEGLVRRLSPDLRAKLYMQLAKSPLNDEQVNAFRYAGKSVDEWLGSALISPATRRLIEPLLYRHGQHFYFADSRIARSEIVDVEERSRLVKALLRQPTLRVRLSIPDVSLVPRLSAYWGAGGRRTDIRPLLESIVGGGADRSLDIIHLLPSFARERLYRYPRLTAEDLDRSQLANCLWTALNFFSETPDARYYDPEFAAARLKQDYYLVENGFRLGDVIAMLDERGNLFHTAVYLADNLVFTKNGQSRVAPWVIVSLDLVKDYYRSRCENPRLLYHRRKDL